MHIFCILHFLICKYSCLRNILINMIELLEQSEQIVSRAPKKFKRYLYNQIEWKNRLIGIKGARGTGKTTLILQRVHELALPAEKAVYLSLDDLYFTNHSLSEFVRTFYKQGGQFLFLDEVHKYPAWAREVKNIHDSHPDISIVFTGSSIVDISRQEADLSRRVLVYELFGLSFREYLEYQQIVQISPLSLESVLTQKNYLKNIFPANFRPYQHFSDYINYGYYPFFTEDVKGYHQRLRQLVRLMVEYDMAELQMFDIRNSRKMLQLLQVISEQVPFKPNLVKLSQKTKIHRNTLTSYFIFLEEARLVKLLYYEGISISQLQKPEKIFLDNTNLIHAMAISTPSRGVLRETFFLNQLKVDHHVHQSKKADFVVDKRYTFEIGGLNKQSKQIEGIENAFLVKDELEYPAGNALPLWVFGFLY